MQRPLYPGEGPQLPTEQETRRAQNPLWTLHSKCSMRFEVLAAMTVHITDLMRGVMASILVACFDMSEVFSDSVFTVIV
jgi:hypothetical protein